MIDPLFNVTDIVVRLLQYRDSGASKWFKAMKNNKRYVTHLDGGQMKFTESGLYRALLKSNKPIAEQFQHMVEDLLKSLR